MAKAPYKTKQMTEILTFLKSVQGRHVTVNEICDFFREKGISVGTTTIYRHNTSFIPCFQNCRDFIIFIS